VLTDDSQQTIPVPDEPTEGECAWCFKLATKKITIRPAQYTHAANGTKVMKKRPIESWACDYHWKSLRRTTDV